MQRKKVIFGGPFSVPLDQTGLVFEPYNILGEIEISISSLAGFYELLSEREIAHYKQNQVLDEFVIYGQFWLSTNGNVFKIMSAELENLHLDFPAVQTREMFETFLEKNIPDGNKIIIEFEPDFYMASQHNCCNNCGQKWSVKDALNYNLVESRKNCIIPITLCEEKTIADMIEEIEKRDKLVYHISDFKEIIIHENEWLGEDEDIGLDTILCQGDAIELNSFQAEHIVCPAKE